MTARKIKHQRALEKREKFMQTVKEGNLNILRKVRDQREEEAKRQERERLERKKEKSKELAKQHGVAKPAHKPMPKGARRKINKKEKS